MVDIDDSHLEFIVRTDSLGELFFSLDIGAGYVELTAKSDDESVVSCLEAYLPVLQERIEELGWKVGFFEAVLNDSIGGHEFVGCQELSSLEGVNVQA